MGFYDTNGRKGVVGAIRAFYFGNSLLPQNFRPQKHYGCYRIQVLERPLNQYPATETWSAVESCAAVNCFLSWTFPSPAARGNSGHKVTYSNNSGNCPGPRTCSMRRWPRQVQKFSVRAFVPVASCA